MHRMKRFMACLLAVSMLLCCCPVTFAEDAAEETVAAQAVETAPAPAAEPAPAPKAPEAPAAPAAPKAAEAPAAPKAPAAPAVTETKTAAPAAKAEPAKAEAPAAEPKAEPAKAETLAAEPKAEPAKAEAPAAEPKAEPAKAEAPAAEPKAEPAKAEAPAAEPKAESVKVETPAAEPKTEAPAEEATAEAVKEDPAVQQPVVEAAAVETEAAEAPAAETPVQTEVTAQTEKAEAIETAEAAEVHTETVAAAPTAGKPAAEEPKAEPAEKDEPEKQEDITAAVAKRMTAKQPSASQTAISAEPAAAAPSPAGPTVLDHYGADGGEEHFTLSASVSSTAGSIETLFENFQKAVNDSMDDIIKDTKGKADGATDAEAKAIFAELNKQLTDEKANIRFSNTATSSGATFKAEFDSFLGLLQGTLGVDNNWDANLNEEGIQHTNLKADTDNATIALSDTTLMTDNVLNNVDFTFTKTTVASDGKKHNSGPASYSSNVQNDDGYYHFASKDHVTMTFDGCDLKQNVSSGSTGNTADNKHLIDLTFKNCDFNGNLVYSPYDNPRDSATQTGYGYVYDADETGHIFKSYQGDNLGNLIFDNCINIHSVNATGANYYGAGSGTSSDGKTPSILSITNCSFAKDVRSGMPEVGEGDIGYRLVFGQNFGGYYFSGNTWNDAAKSPIYVEAFDNAGFSGAKKVDYFYQETPAIEGDQYWNNPNEDGTANLVMNGATDEVKPDGQVDTFFVYVAREPEPTVPPTDPTKPTDPTEPTPPPTDPTDPTKPTDPTRPTDPVPPPETVPPTEPETTPETTPETVPETTVPYVIRTVEEVEVEEEEVPLAGGGPAWALYNFALMELAIFESICMLVGYFVKVKKEEADELKKKLLPRLISVLVAIGSIIAFVLTENIHVPLILVDRWTPLMVVFAVGQSLVAMLSKKSYGPPPENFDFLEEQEM